MPVAAFGVAPPGRRLRPRFPVEAITALALVPVVVVGLVVVTLVAARTVGQ